jgi:hypothetical protein
MLMSWSQREGRRARLGRLRHAAERSDASDSSQERMCFHALLGSKFVIEGVPSFAQRDRELSDGWQANFPSPKRSVTCSGFLGGVFAQSEALFGGILKEF